MNSLSDKRLEEIKKHSTSLLWYITKQDCNFRNLAMIASILESWNDNPKESFQDYFDRMKVTIPYNSYIVNTPHRALKNCEFYGLMSSSIDVSSRSPYSSRNLTDNYKLIKEICKGNFQDTKSEEYKNEIDKLLEKMTIKVDNNEMFPVMYTLKILSIIGDITGDYSIDVKEFKLFVCTSSNWNQYWQSVESILRYREDDVYKNNVLKEYNYVNNTRFNSVFANNNLSYVNLNANKISINADCENIVKRKVAEFEVGSIDDDKLIKRHSSNIDIALIENFYYRYFDALRTKPFLLLAGISGTGKSRIVRELAFMSCPKELQDEDGTTPGNYCMVEVKPNWHDSTELLGYYSNIRGKYMFTPFVKFLIKAKKYPSVPFFVCLDEMNLAPVEQYFAEFLSVLETRKLKEIDNILSGPIIKKDFFDFISVYNSKVNYVEGSDVEGSDDKVIASKQISELDLVGCDDICSELLTKGLTLPDNVFVIGTVNMDDTTYKFSRKVIDRAMTIEMNGGKLHEMFGHSSQLSYRDDVIPLEMFKPKYVTADDAINNCDSMHEFQARVMGSEDDTLSVASRLKAINDCLIDTPFQVSYRVLNELVIYLAVLLDAENNEVDEDKFNKLLDKAIDDITLMKILPRIEGDDEMFERKDDTGYSLSENRFDELLKVVPVDGNSYKKIQEMQIRLLRSSFTRFWP